MRILLIPALALIMGNSAFAKDEHHDWQFRSHGRPEFYRPYPQYNAYERRGWDRPRYEHRRDERSWYPEHDVVVVRPEPLILRARPLPLPPPPPVGIHLWFGF